MQVELPAEVLLLIVDQIADFGLWYNARIVCHSWLARIVAEQDTKVWDFVKFRNNAFLLPNGVKHGITVESQGEYREYLRLYRYGKQFGAGDIYNDELRSRYYNELRSRYSLYSIYNNFIHFEYITLDSFQCIIFETNKSAVGFKINTEGLFECDIITKSYKYSFSLPYGKFEYIEYYNPYRPAISPDIDYLSDND